MATLAQERIGFIGLGLMGKPMSRHLRRAGATLLIYNRSPDVMTELAAEGMQCASSPRAVAQGSGTIILMLSDTPAVEMVLFNKDGVLAGLQPNGLVIDMGTTAVTATRHFAAAVEVAGGAYLDAPVSGGQVGAAEACLTIMVGGTADALARARPVLEVLGKRITHVGEAGAGQVAKAANQVIVGLTIGAVAEALTLAKRTGVDPAKVREALAGGFAWSRILELHGQRMIDGVFAPGGKATTQRKDIAQALELASTMNLELPATALNLKLYDQLIAMGDGELDHSALVRVIDVA
jgi:3-hydroxyisobutyrate dehydrogenase-like beta-hydroxyacid dehydrogenase